MLFRPQAITPDAWEDRHSLLCDVEDDPERDYRTFYRENYLELCGPNPHIHYRERHRMVLGMLRALFPFEAGRWGMRPANDNEPIA